MGGKAKAEFLYPTSPYPPSPKALRRAPQRGGITSLFQIVLDKSAPDPLNRLLT